MLMMCEARRLEVALDEVELLLLVVVGELGLVAESRALAGCGSRDGSDCGACGCATCYASVCASSKLSAVCGRNSVGDGLGHLVGSSSGDSRSWACNRCSGHRSSGNRSGGNRSRGNRSSGHRSSGHRSSGRRGSGGGSGGGGSGSGGGSHLNGNTASKGPSTSGVFAADHADTCLPCDLSCASHSSGDRGCEGKVLHLSVAVTSTIAALKVLGDSDGLPVRASACGIDHALVRTSTIGVDLVDGHHDLATSGDLRKGSTAHGHHRSSSGSDVVVTSTKSLSTSGGGIATEPGGVLLEGVAASAVTRSGGVDTDRRSLTTSIAGCSDDGCVAGHERRGSQKAESSNNGGLGEKHTEPVR
jgi:hypothetical protein